MLDPAPPPASSGVKGETSIQELAPAQRTVARRTAEARATVPDFETAIEVEVSAALAGAEQSGTTLDGLLVAACAAALRAVPRANGAYRDGRLELYSRVNIGVVVAHEDAYVIPTVFDADAKDAVALSREVERLRAAAVARELPSPAFSGATFTVWNAGAVGLERATMVINPPQAAALAAGAVRDAPVVRDGEVRPGRLTTLTLACDHRILYGELAGRFLTAVGGALTTPSPP